jgi:hypothetical protein
MSDTKREAAPGKVPVIMKPRHLKAIDREHYGVFRETVIRKKDLKTGQTYDEHVGEIGPLFVYRESRADDPIHIESFHPTEHRPMRLTLVFDASKGEAGKDFPMPPGLRSKMTP